MTMPAQKRDTRPAGPEVDEHNRLNAAIGSRVIDALGRPADYFGVQVRRLWENHYRVNVLIGPDAASTTVAHSYFLVADDAGIIRVTTPPITRRYES